MALATSTTRTRPRGSLTREEIINEALALLEEHGSGALSMRRLADRLGVAPNALYTHVRGKADLIDGLVDQVYAGLELHPTLAATGPSSWPPSARPSATTCSPTRPSSPTPFSNPALGRTACVWAKPSTTSCGPLGSPTRPWSAPSMPW
jgi:AcrR family transcriptional regulator